MVFSPRLKMGAVLIMLVPLMSLNLAASPAQKNPFPWKFGGYEKIEALHFKYWSPSKDAFEDEQNFAKASFPTEISEVWYSKSAQSVRVDKYVEKGTVKCNKFKGKEWEMITENGKEYVLKERVIQTGTTRTLSYLENIMSGGGTELCEYKSSQGTRGPFGSIKNFLGILTLSPYLADPEYEELAVSSLELDEAMNPQKYKATMAELKKTYDKAGRKTAKHETSHGIIRFRAQGDVFVDLEWGMGLEGYITKIQGSGQPLTLSSPVCIYKVLSLETKIDDPKVFEK